MCKKAQKRQENAQACWKHPGEPMASQREERLKRLNG
jgi:hypothetical protein